MFRVGGGWDHTTYLELDGSVWIHGHNQYGELGLGDLIQRNTPIKLQGLPPMKSVSSGHNTTLLLDEEGCVWSAGMNSRGELGLGDTEHRNTFERIPDIPQIKEIANHYEHSILLDYNGSAWVFGNSPHKTEGTSSKIPSKIADLPPIQTACTGASFSLLVDERGLPWAINASRLSAPEHGPIEGLPPIKAVGGGLRFGAFLDENGTVWAKGDSFTHLAEPGMNASKVSRNLEIQSISCGLSHLLMIDNEKNCWAFGANKFGETPKNSGNAPNKVEEFPNVLAVAAGGYYSVMLNEEGAIASCGINCFGQLGLGDRCERRKPTVNPHLPPILLAKKYSNTKSARKI